MYNAYDDFRMQHFWNQGWKRLHQMERYNGFHYPLGLEMHVKTATQVHFAKSVEVVALGGTLPKAFTEPTPMESSSVALFFI